MSVLRRLPLRLLGMYVVDGFGYLHPAKFIFFRIAGCRFTVREKMPKNAQT